MQYVRLGTTGLKVSRICLGMMSFGSTEWRDWALSEERAEPIVRRGVERGINFFDTADVYSHGLSEEITGRMLSKYFTHRNDYVIATKTYSPMGPGPNDRGLSRKRLLSAVDDSLRRLGTDYIDLYQLHHWDHDTPIEETMEALHDLVRWGKVRYIGASNFSAWQFMKAQYAAERHGWTRLVSVQNHYNLLHRETEREMVPLCLDMGIGLTPWSPLARGILAGTRTRAGERRTARAQSDTRADELYGEPDYDVVEGVTRLGAEREVPSAQVALAWLLHKPGISAPIVGATNAAHVDDAVAALEMSLGEAEIRRLEGS